MASIQIRLSFLLLLLHVSVFAAPISLRWSSDNVEPALDHPLKGARQDHHAKRQSSSKPMPPLNVNIHLCISPDGIIRSLSNVHNSVSDTSGVPSSLSNALPLCDGTGSNTQGALTHIVGLTNSQNTLSAVEASLGRLSGSTNTGTAPMAGLPSSLISEISAVDLANVNPSSRGSHSVHVISGGGSDGSMGNTEVHLPALGGLLEIGSSGTTAGSRPLSQLGSTVGMLSGGTISSTTTGPILANGALGIINSGILGGRLGSGVPGSLNSQSLDIASGGGSQGSLGSTKIGTPVFGSAIAIGTGSNDRSGIPAVSEGGQSSPPTHDNSPKPNSDPSSENSNGTPSGQKAPGDNRHGQPNNNPPANSPNADQNSGTNGRAPPTSSTGQNSSPSSPPPNRGSAPNASNPAPNGPNPGNRAPAGTTNQGGNIAEISVDVPGNGQHLGANGLVRQGNM